MTSVPLAGETSTGMGGDGGTVNVLLSDQPPGPLVVELARTRQ